MKKPFTPEEFKAIYSKVPRISVDLVISLDGGIVLILRALESYKNQWHLPGGTVFYKEKIIDAVKRIAKDETGLDVSVEELLGYIEYESEEKERGFGYTIGMVFACTKIGGTICLNEDGSDLKSFKTLPEKTVIDQKKFLETLNLDNLTV